MKKLFMFPGQGSQSVGMAKSLVENFPLAKQLFEEANDALRFDLRKVCFDGPESDLKLTHITQPAILTHSIAAFRVLSAETPLKPDYVAGHSLGEYSALVAAGALPFSEAVRLVNKRGQFMQEAVPVGTGSMAAMIGGTEEQVTALCAEAARMTGKVCEMANFNGGGQIVVSGHKEAVEEAVRIVEQDGATYGIGRAVLLTVSAPFHCSLMKKAEDNMRPLLEKVVISGMTCPYVANVDAKVHNQDGLVDRLLRQICGSVRWEQSIQTLTGEQVSQAYEIGPGKVLSGLYRRIDKQVKCKGVDTMEDIKALA